MTEQLKMVRKHFDEASARQTIHWQRPKPMTYTDKLKALVRSRRAQATAGSILAVLFHDVLGLTFEEAAVIAGAIASWVWSDARRETK